LRAPRERDGVFFAMPDVGFVCAEREWPRHLREDALRADVPAKREFVC
jgi:hypothetical protein